MKNATEIVLSTKFRWINKSFRQERWEGKGSRGEFSEASETKEHPEYEDCKVPLGRKDLKGLEKLRVCR